MSSGASTRRDGYDRVIARLNISTRIAGQHLEPMINSFGTEAVAWGYATSRPPVHLRIIEKARKSLGVSQLAHRALDVGCGAGLSTRALTRVAKECIGMEPADAMLKWGAMIAPQANFVAGTAEAIPIRDDTIDLITAAGSLNYVNLALFFPEATRVLRLPGVLIIYDFLPGRSFRESSTLDEWFTSFVQRYPEPAAEARILNPEILAQLDSGFRMRSYEHFEIGIVLAPQFYIDYMLTETNVGAAIRNGVHLDDIKSWCADTLKPIWNGRQREVLFRGYFACMAKT